MSPTWLGVISGVISGQIVGKVGEEVGKKRGVESEGACGYCKYGGGGY